MKVMTMLYREEMELFNNYPNPFNPATTITFRAAKDDHYSLRVYNLSGQQVAELLNEYRQTGTYKVSFDASHLTSGTYFLSSARRRYGYG